MSRTLDILPLGPMERDPGLPAWLAAALARRLGVRARVGAPLELRPEWSAPRRRQLSSNRVLTALVDRDGGRQDAGWTVGLTDADLFAPRRSYVFGEATRGGNWAVVSTARLQAEVSVLRDRVLKEVIHETGHLAGLRHCADPGCVMYPAVSAADTDVRPAVFCSACDASFGICSGLEAK